MSPRSISSSRLLRRSLAQAARADRRWRCHGEAGCRPRRRARRPRRAGRAQTVLGELPVSRGSTGVLIEVITERTRSAVAAMSMMTPAIAIAERWRARRRYMRRAGPGGRARTGSPARKRSRSSASSSAVAYLRAGFRSIAFKITASRSRGKAGLECPRPARLCAYELRDGVKSTHAIGQLDRA